MVMIVIGTGPVSVIEDNSEWMFFLHRRNALPFLLPFGRGGGRRGGRGRSRSGTRGGGARRRVPFLLLTVLFRFVLPDNLLLGFLLTLPLNRLLLFRGNDGWRRLCGRESNLVDLCMGGEVRAF